jgi:Cdc6-like AAA superfamily ATPase
MATNFEELGADVKRRRSKLEALASVAETFTPGAPIDDFALFAGRIEQLTAAVTTVAQKGRHVALYGDRGVGKTSLANVISQFFELMRREERHSVRINCNSDMTFGTLWGLLFRELDVVPDTSELAPEDVRYHLARLSTPAIIVIDELDRMEDDETLSLLADTIKSLSDNAVPSTLVLVGVATSIDGLIGEHESIDRALEQIEMPRMSVDELLDLIGKCCERCEMRIENSAAHRIARLSEGLPHYTHTLGLHAGQHAVSDDHVEIGPADVRAAIEKSVEKHTVRTEYEDAIRSPRRDNLYAEVLLACALADKDRFGFFSAGAVRNPLSQITSRDYDIPAFARHLKEFTRAERGPALMRIGAPHRYFYRFTNPVLQPYVILVGLSSGLITEDGIAELESPVSDPTGS